MPAGAGLDYEESTILAALLHSRSRICEPVYDIARYYKKHKFVTQTSMWAGSIHTCRNELEIHPEAQGRSGRARFEEFHPLRHLCALCARGEFYFPSVASSPRNM